LKEIVTNYLVAAQHGMDVIAFEGLMPDCSLDSSENPKAPEPGFL
jgi:hypothetical protein